MSKNKIVGADWLADEIEGLTDHIDHISPTQFNEDHRYLPESVTPMPGYIRYDVNPFMREILDCFDIDSPVREVNLMKGVQITYSTLLESGFLYFMRHIKTVPIMYMTADKELATARIENNFIPMINHSGFADSIRSSDEGNSRKTGKTANHIQWEGGGYMVPFGAKNADKMRSFSIMVMLKDEIDAWPDTVGKDGDPDKVSDDRCAAYWERRKIFRGSTPLIIDNSKIFKAYKRGDQRKYLVLCRSCSFPQELRWSGANKETGKDYGFAWDLDDGILIPESVRYLCQNCQTEHFEHDKENLFSLDHGAHWNPTARPQDRNIRSYHLPALYSPIGMQPWYKSVASYLDGYDHEKKKVRDVAKYQVFYNNVLAMPFTVQGARITNEMVSNHRRAEYTLGHVPNNLAVPATGGRILFLTCTVDVHKGNLAVSVWGWTRGMQSFLVDYWRFEDEDCTQPESPVWTRLRELIEEKEYIANDKVKYRISTTFIDSRYAYDTVCNFCADYESGVYPIMGQDKAVSSSVTKEFSPFKTQIGTKGFRVTVDHYKDRLAPVMRRVWDQANGKQREYHFNVPVDLLDKQLKELTVESRRKRTDDRGRVSYYWFRPTGVNNELWDLIVYGQATVEVMAWSVCIDYLELDEVSWPMFWDHYEAMLDVPGE